MTLIVSRKEAEGILDLACAMEVLEPVMIEEIQGTASHISPSGGGRSLRLVGGILKGMGRMGVRVRGQASVYDTESGELLGVVSYREGGLRVGATMALAARYLARPDAKSIGLLGSGNNALTILRAMKLVRPIERVEIFSPTEEHRNSFAARATLALGIPVTAHPTADPVTDDADIIVVATNSRTPVLSAADLRPGTHVSSMGVYTELDGPVYLAVNQFVTPSRAQEIAGARRGNVGGRGTLVPLLEEGKIAPDSIVELGSIINGHVPPRNGPTDINLFRESQGGAGDIALANYIYEFARANGLGVDVEL